MEHFFAAIVFVFAEFDAVARCGIDDVLHHLVAYLIAIVEIGESGVLAEDKVAVFVDIVDAVLRHNAFGDDVAVIIAILCGVERDEYVGHNATTAVDGAIVLDGAVTERIGEMYAVGAVEFALVVAINQVHIVAFLVAFGVGLLNASARRGVVTSHGEAHHRAIFENKRALHETLAEGSATHNHAAVVVLNGAR